MLEPHADINVIPPTSHTGSTSKPSPIAGLTTFPNCFEDEPEQGILPSLLSKVKSTFNAASASLSTTTPAPLTNRNSSGTTGIEKGIAEGGGSGGGIVQTEAQAIVEATKRAQKGDTRRQTGGGPSSISINIPNLNPSLSSETVNSRLSPSATSPRRIRGLRPPISSNSTQPSSPQPVFLSQASSIASSSSVTTRNKIEVLSNRSGPGDRKWRPTGAAPAQVTVSPVTSVTTTIQATTTGPVSTRSSLDEPAPKIQHHAHFGLQSVISSSSRPRRTSITHGRSNSSNLRLRRSSISTIPDSPSSVSLSAMIASNAELSQNFSYVPGFPLPQDDTRSVRSVAFGQKKLGSVSKIIRRMRGEGLSKHYWMADEHCKECYDCKSVSRYILPR